MPCPIPEYLSLGDVALPKARQQLARTDSLVILTLGGAPTAGIAAGDPSATYPALLQADLSLALPGKSVSVVNKARAEGTVGTLPKDIDAVIRQSSASLVIWASGSREAARSADVDEYVGTLQRGIAAIRGAGADLILLDLQYAPSIARITNTGPYRDALFGTALAYEVPVLRRYDLMMTWIDGGIIDLDAQDATARRKAARHLFSCIATALAPSIARAVK